MKGRPLRAATRVSGRNVEIDNHCPWNAAGSVLPPLNQQLTAQRDAEMKSIGLRDGQDVRPALPVLGSGRLSQLAHPSRAEAAFALAISSGSWLPQPRNPSTRR